VPYYQGHYEPASVPRRATQPLRSLPTLPDGGAGLAARARARAADSVPSAAHRQAQTLPAGGGRLEPFSPGGRGGAAVLDHLMSNVDARGGAAGGLWSMEVRTACPPAPPAPSAWGK
jgi:hypothetical protein